MMKKIFLLLFVLLFLLSGCAGYTRSQVDDMMQSRDEEYFDIENKYYTEAGKVDKYETALLHIEDDVITLHLFFYGDDSISYSEAHNAADHLHDILSELY